MTTSADVLMYQLQNAITLTMTSTSTLSTFTVAAASGINGESTTYTFSFTPGENIIAGDKVTVTPPSTVTFTGTTCAGTANLASSLTCALSGTSIVMTVALSRLRYLAAGDAGQVHSFTVDGVTNAPSLTTTDTFTVAISDSADAAM